LADAEKQLAEIPILREAIGVAKGEAEALREAVQHEREARSRAEAEAATLKERASLALGELQGVKLATEHQHAELAQMRREVAEAHNRVIAAEQQVIEATRQREGAEAALAKARKWSFLNFLFDRQGKGRL
jgi:chromosome segregation ATPase